MVVKHVCDLPGSWPASSECSQILPEEVDRVAAQISQQLSELLLHPDRAYVLIAEVFHPQGFWRDIVALTWSLRTFQSQKRIIDTVPALLNRASVTDVQYLKEHTIQNTLPNGLNFIGLRLSFQTGRPQAICTLAVTILKLADGTFKVFTVTSTIQELLSQPWRSPFEAARDTKAAADNDHLPAYVDAIIVGAGQGGLGVAAHFKALNISCAVLERDANVGDSWAQRYDSAALHTTKLFSGLPYIPFPKEYPEYVPAKLIGQYHRDYVRALQLPVYTAREIKSTTYDEESRRWTVQVQHGETSETIEAKHIVFAIGAGGRFPSYPNIPGRGQFKGEELHSATYRNAKAWKGKKVVVLGASTTALDIGQDCAREGIDVTLVQRGHTRVYPQGHIGAAQDFLWKEGTPTEVADTISSQDPLKLQAQLSEVIMDQLQDGYDPDYYTGMKKAGFLAQTSGSKLQQIFVAFGSHYPDVGACADIISGKIKVRSGTQVEAIKPDGVSLAGGAFLPADILVYATGFVKDFREQIQDLAGAASAAKLHPIWGLDAEGEVSGVWRPSGHDGLWIQVGDLQTMRFYGKYLAMQIAAEVAGIRPEPWVQ